MSAANEKNIASSKGNDDDEDSDYFEEDREAKQSDSEPDDDDEPSIKQRKKRRKGGGTHYDPSAATLTGQLKLHPEYTEDEARAEAKREYNRQNAARVRQRKKNMVSDLKNKVSEMEQRLKDMVDRNDVLAAKVEVLQEQNARLIAQHGGPRDNASNNVATANRLAAASNTNHPQQPIDFGALSFGQSPYVPVGNGMPNGNGGLPQQPVDSSQVLAALLQGIVLRLVPQQPRPEPQAQELLQRVQQAIQQHQQQQQHQPPQGRPPA